LKGQLNLDLGSTAIKVVLISEVVSDWNLSDDIKHKYEQQDIT